MTESTSTTTSAHHHTSQRPKRRVLRLVMLIVFFALAVGLGVTGYLYYKTKLELQKLSTPDGQREVALRETKAIVDKLGKLTLLPDENPVIATIVDSKYLATQSAFYKDTQNGDKLVVYSKSQRAYIYSPAKNIIVNSGPLLTDPKNAQAGTQQQPQAQPSPAAQTQTLQVEVRNGTNTVGVATKIKQEIDGNGAEVVKVGDAVKKDYKKTQVYAVNKSVSAAQMSTLATKVKGEVVSLFPAGEATSSADVLIIVGE